MKTSCPKRFVNIFESEIFDSIARLIYVEYLRSDVTQAHASGKAPVLTERILSELPTELLKKLCHVTVMLYRAANRLGTTHPILNGGNSHDATDQ